MREAIYIIVALLILVGCQNNQPGPDIKILRQQVKETETAFAKTMADRDHEAFKSFLAEETVFFSGTKALRGKKEVADAWQRFYEKPEAPFSWQPDQVEVLESGKLALSTGPVQTPDGKVVGTFNSIWWLEAPGVWRIVFDKGCDVCDCAGED